MKFLGTAVAVTATCCATNYATAFVPSLNCGVQRRAFASSTATTSLRAQIFSVSTNHVSSLIAKYVSMATRSPSASEPRAFARRGAAHEMHEYVNQAVECTLMSLGEVTQSQLNNVDWRDVNPISKISCRH